MIFLQHLNNHFPFWWEHEVTDTISVRCPRETVSLQISIKPGNIYLKKVRLWLLWFWHMPCSLLSIQVNLLLDCILQSFCNDRDWVLIPRVPTLKIWPLKLKLKNYYYRTNKGEVWVSLPSVSLKILSLLNVTVWSKYRFKRNICTLCIIQLCHT